MWDDVNTLPVNDYVKGGLKRSIEQSVGTIAELIDERKIVDISMEPAEPLEITNKLL